MLRPLCWPAATKYTSQAPAYPESPPVANLPNTVPQKKLSSAARGLPGDTMRTVVKGCCLPSYIRFHLGSPASPQTLRIFAGSYP